jgi:hypothetical protein
MVADQDLRQNSPSGIDKAGLDGSDNMVLKLA